MRSKWIHLITIACLIGLVAFPFSEGRRRGMDHAITFGADHDKRSIAIAISDLYYNLNEGYISHALVLAKLGEYLNRHLPDANNPDDLPLLNDRDNINSALLAAASLGQLPSARLQDYTLQTVLAEDVGYSDFYKLAFQFFGLRIESTYYLYFLLLSLSVVTFYLIYFDSLVARAILQFELMAFCILMFFGPFSQLLPSVASNRFLSTLVILPGIHLLLPLAMKIKIRPWLFGLGAMIQALILTLAVHFRSSANWSVLAVFAIAAFMWLWRRKNFSRFAWMALVALVTAMGVVKGYTYVHTNSIYETDEFLPHHLRWHNAFIGFTLSPEWVEIYPEEAKTSGDSVPIRFAEIYLKKRNPPIEPNSPQDMPKWRLHDETVKRLVFRQIVEYPGFVFRLFAIHKVREFFRALRHSLSSQGRPLELIMFICLTMFGIIANAWLAAMAQDSGPRSVATDSSSIAVLIGIFTVISLLPIFWAYPQHYVMFDQLWTILATIFVGVWAAAVKLGVQISGRTPAARFFRNILETGA